MAKNISNTPLERAEIALTAAVEEEPRRARRDGGSPFRILVLGDFSGRESRGVDPADLGFVRRPVRVDRDTVDDALEQMGIKARLQLLEGGPFITLSMRRLEDFHPDRLFEDAPALAHLFETRRNLQTSEGFESAAREVRSWSPSFDGRAQDEVPIVETTAPTMAPPPPPGHRISEILDRRSGKSQEAAPEDLDAFVRQIVRPHLVPDSSEQEQLLEAVDASVGSWMRTVLHHPKLHALEAAWRGVAFLVGQIESDSTVEVFLLDVSKEELASDLRAVDNLEKSRIWRLLTDERPGSEEQQTWSLAVGLYRFGPTIEDVALLGRLAKVARAAGAPFLAEASPRVLGCDSLAESPSSRSWRRDDPADQLWEALRGLPESSSVGLALPRFLLRLPYGAETEPLESFRFEEMEGALDAENLLWGNPALACGALLARTFERNGPRFRPGAIRDIEGLPLYLSREAGQTRVMPCAEVVLSDSTAEDILEKGLIPILSLPDRDVIRVVRFQSIAFPASGLAGPWG